MFPQRTKSIKTLLHVTEHVREFLGEGFLQDVMSL